ncbi:hypothetical protein [Sphingomonas faeni]|uniref:hypothetical protein n=1 Tax=Sphingomonas faeni TaxID=185950 RepID=UPI00334C128C
MNDIIGVARVLKPANIPELKEEFYAGHLIESDEYASPEDFFKWLLQQGYIEDVKPVREFLGTDRILDMPR